MWQRAQKSSSSEPEPDVVWVVAPMLKVEVQSALAKGLICALAVPSGGLGMSQPPSVAVSRAISRKAPRHPGSRQELDIIEPFHSLKIREWQVSQTPGLLAPFQSASYGGGWLWASLTL